MRIRNISLYLIIGSIFQRNNGIIPLAKIEEFINLQKSGIEFSYVEEIVPEIGGPLYIRAHYLYIKNCSFIENNGNLGGAISMNKHENVINEQIAVMENLIFTNNTGGESGCIDFSSDLEFFTAYINFSYFYQNQAGCNIYPYT